MQKTNNCCCIWLCIRGGCELAMMCDFILAAENVVFGQPEINLGIIPGAGGTQRLPKIVGKSKSMEMVLTGQSRFMNAEEAERIGLVSRIVKGDLIEDALKTANKIAKLSLTSLILAKELVNKSFEVPLTEGLKTEKIYFHSLFGTSDQKEGMLAFSEKRKPNFKN